VNGLTVFDHLKHIRINQNSGAFAYCLLPIANFHESSRIILLPIANCQFERKSTNLSFAYCQSPIGIVAGNDCIKKYRKTQAGQ